MSNKLIKLVAPFVFAALASCQTCEHSAQLISTPEDFREWQEANAATGKQYHDYNFQQYHMLYWLDYIGHADKVAWDQKFNKKNFENDKMDF